MGYEGPRTAEGQEEISMRLEAAYKDLRESPVAKAYWQLMVVLSKFKFEDLTGPDQETLKEVRETLEGSVEIKTLKVLAEKLGKEKSFPEEKAEG